MIIKKKGLKGRSYRLVEIQGLEGCVKFRLERYEGGGDYFESSGQFVGGLESEGLKEWIKHDIQHKSYAVVSRSLEMLTGAPVYSGNHLSEKVKEYAQESTKEVISSYADVQLCLAFADGSVDIYDSSCVEIGLFDDAIGVKRQKEKREKEYKKTLKTVQTDVLEVELPSGKYEYITAGYGVDNWNVESALTCFFSKHYGTKKLPIVAITDGARNIRERLHRIFGQQIVLILDWYHLHKKMKELLSMAACNKKQKEQWLKHIMPLLWEGKTQEVTTYLATLVPRNTEKHQEAIDYLTKHNAEIINYKKRKDAKKTIGSGRAEKGVDLVVAQRQKNKPIAWSQNGSRALAVLKAQWLNSKNAA